jgi:putative membrane protein
MAKTEPEQADQKHIIVLCVDRDGDIGTKANVKTPIMGREQNIDAAVNLALSDPEEPDSNAMFEAVRIYDRLKGEDNPKETFQIATISGSELGGVGADRKVVGELGEVLSLFPANEVVLVMDGYSDEAVLPLVQSRVPVTSISRIVVKHSESIEESAALFSRYLRTVVENPRYSRFVLGVPGVLVLIAAVLWMFNLLSIFWIVLVFVLSAIMVIKGFGADRAAKNFYRWIREYNPPPLKVQISSFSLLAGSLLLILGVYYGGATTAAYIGTMKPLPKSLGAWLSISPQLLGYFIGGSAILIAAGICIALLGRAIRWYLEHDTRLLRNAALIVTIGWSTQILNATSNILITPTYGYDKIIFTVIVGVLIAIASALTILVVHRSSRQFFRATKEQAEEFGEE